MNNKGFFHRIPIYILAIIGVFLLYKSYLTHNLSSDFGFMIESCQKLAEKARMSDSDRRNMMDSFTNIQEIAKKNNINGLLTNGYK